MRNPVRPPGGFFNRRLSTRQNSSVDKVSASCTFTFHFHFHFHYLAFPTFFTFVSSNQIRNESANNRFPFFLLHLLFFFPWASKKFVCQTYNLRKKRKLVPTFDIIHILLFLNLNTVCLSQSLRTLNRSASTFTFQYHFHFPIFKFAFLRVPPHRARERRTEARVQPTWSHTLSQTLKEERWPCLLWIFSYLLSEIPKRNVLNKTNLYHQQPINTFKQFQTPDEGSNPPSIVVSQPPFWNLRKISSLTDVEQLLYVLRLKAFEAEDTHGWWPTRDLNWWTRSEASSSLNPLCTLNSFPICTYDVPQQTIPNS